MSGKRPNDLAFWTRHQEWLRAELREAEAAVSALRAELEIADSRLNELKSSDPQAVQDRKEQA